jgi:hypothetical protein
MATQERYTWTDTGNWMRAIGDAIELTDPLQAMMPKLLGFSESNVSKFRIVNWPSTKVEWITDTELPMTNQLAEALDNSETDVDVDDGGYFSPGDVIKVDNELMFVASIATNTLTVVRGYGDTSAAAHDDDSTVTIAYRANNEGGSFPLVVTTTTLQPYNYTQTFRYRIWNSATSQRLSRYGVDDEINYHLAKLWNDGGGAGRAAKELENTFFYGERIQRSSTGYSNGTTGSMGGFKTFVTTHTDTAGGDITKPRIHEMLRSISDEGGTVEYIMGNAYQIEKIVNFYEGQRVMTQDSKLGGYNVTSIETPFMPPVKLLNNYRTPSGHLYLFSAKDMGWMPFRPYTVRDLPNADDVAADKGLVGELTFILQNERFQGYFTGLSTS